MKQLSEAFSSTKAGDIKLKDVCEAAYKLGNPSLITGKNGFNLESLIKNKVFDKKDLKGAEEFFNNKILIANRSEWLGIKGQLSNASFMIDITKSVKESMKLSPKEDKDADNIVKQALAEAGEQKKSKPSSTISNPTAKQIDGGHRLGGEVTI